MFRPQISSTQRVTAQRFITKKQDTDCQKNSSPSLPFEIGNSAWRGKDQQAKWGFFLSVSLILLFAFTRTETAQARYPSIAEDDPVLEPLPFTDVGSVSFFGGALAMDGNTMVIGSDATEISPEDNNVDLFGAVYIYTFDEADATDEATGWTQQAKLIPPDAAELDQEIAFGHAVALEGGTLAVGASRNTLDGYRGAVYVYSGSGSDWAFESRLSIPNTSDDEFLAGTSIAISGDTIAVGIPDSAGTNNEVGGQVYLFERSGTTWSLAATLSATDGEAGTHEQFGTAVALDQNRLVVGDKHGATDFPGTRGALYIYTREAGGWQFEAKLDSPINDASGDMGNAVAIEDDVIVAGAEGEKSGSNILQGAIHIFVRHRISENRHEWRHAYRFTAPDGAQVDRFGRSVSIRDRLIVAGAYLADVDGVENLGAAYVFAPTAGAWVNVLKLTAPDGEEDDVLGDAVANNGEWVAIGAPHLDGAGGASIGRTYVVKVTDLPEGRSLFLPLVHN